MNTETLDLLRDVSHRLRSPLATVYGYASLLEAHATDGLVDPADLAEWARKIQAEAERLDALIGDLSRLRVASSGELRRVPCDLRQVLAAAVSPDRAPVLEHGPAVMFEADIVLLGRAFHHLLLSATHARLVDNVTTVRVQLEMPVAWRQPNPTDAWWRLCEATIAGHHGALIVSNGCIVVELPRLAA